MTETIELEIHVESFSTRELYLIKRLREFRTIDADLRSLERVMNGIGLLHEPRITAAAPVRDYMAWLERVGYDLPDDERELVETLKRHISLADFAQLDNNQRARLTYASSERVASRLSHTFSDDPDEDSKLQRAYELLVAKQKEAYLHLTDTERVADERLTEREKAKARYEILVNRKRIISEALADMEKYYHEQYLILWYKFVLNERWQKVCEIAGRDGAELTPDEYRTSRKKALKQFNRWAKGI